MIKKKTKCYIHRHEPCHFLFHLCTNIWRHFWLVLIWFQGSWRSQWRRKNPLRGDLRSVPLKHLSKYGAFLLNQYYIIATWFLLFWAVTFWFLYVFFPCIPLDIYYLGTYLKVKDFLAWLKSFFHQLFVLLETAP